jgi:BirA family biotin operon repressor/biotin-[acetyl-CoA-carboxylase] ligase
MFDLARLAATGLVAHIDYHESIGSTSDRALALAAEAHLPLPILVLAEEQTAGRGRGANRWLTTAGALTFSLVLDAPPDRLPPERWPQVALVAGLATCEALLGTASTADLRLKWPNDVLLGGRKLAGILSESVPGWRDRLVIGIGVNVNNNVDLAIADQGPKPLPRPPISLIEHDRIERDLTTVLTSILDHFDRRWHELLADGHDALLAAYRQRCSLTGRTVTIEQPGGRRHVGICHGLDPLGRLVLQTEHGRTPISSGTVVAWEP